MRVEPEWTAAEVAFGRPVVGLLLNLDGMMTPLGTMCPEMCIHLPETGRRGIGPERRSPPVLCAPGGLPPWRG